MIGGDDSVLVNGIFVGPTHRRDMGDKSKRRDQQGKAAPSQPGDVHAFLVTAQVYGLSCKPRSVTSKGTTASSQALPRCLAMWSARPIREPSRVLPIRMIVLALERTSPLSSGRPSRSSSITSRVVYRR